MDGTPSKEAEEGVSRPPADEHLSRPLLLYEDD